MAETRPDEAQFDVFISYARRDAGAWTRRLAENLHQLGLEVWFDAWEIGPGDVIVHGMERGLRQAKHGALVVSPAALESHWVQEEYAVLLQQAVEQGRRLIPVLFAEVESLPPFLGTRHWVDFRGADGTVYEEKVRELAAALRGDRPQRPERTGKLQPPPGTGLQPEGPILRTLVVAPQEVRLLGGNDEVRDEVPPPDTTLENELWKLSRTRRQAGQEEIPTRAVAAAEAPPVGSKLHQQLLETGALLSDRYLSGTVGQALARAVVDAERWGVALELGVRVEDPKFTSIPWETLRLPGSQGVHGPPLSLHPNVHLYRSVQPGGPVADVQVPGPLRILVAIGSPEEQNKAGELLDYEAELERILDSVDPARQRGEAHVRILHRGTVDAIQQALKEERYHVLYISCHAGPGVLILENEDGAKDEVDARKLVEHLPVGRRPPLVVLAGCATARGQWEIEVPEPGQTVDQDTTEREQGEEDPKASYLPGLAESLLSRGVPAVVAMQAPVGDVYARRLGAQLFASLATSEIKEPLRALTAARRALEDKRRENPDRWDQAEWATPSLYLPETGPATRASRPLFSADRDTWKEIEQVTEPTFAEGVVHRREGFVGRRKEERLARKALLGDKKSGVLIHGLGGVGKSTLAAELLARLREDHLLVSVVEETSPDQLLAAVGDQLFQFGLANGFAEDHPLRQISGLLRRQDLPWEQRFELLTGSVLNQLPLLLLIDNFEDNLVGLDEGWEVKDPHLAQLLASWLHRPGKSRILVTSRHPFVLPDEAEGRLQRFHLGPLSLAETRKLFWRLPQLDALDREQQEQAYAVVGGHPRTLEYLDALLAGGEARFLDVEKKLRDTLREKNLEPDKWFEDSKGDLDQALAAAVTLAGHDVALRELVARLDGHPLARKLLFRASVYRLPVDSIGLAWQVGKEVEVEEDPEREERRKNLEERAREARKEGKDLTAGTLGYSEQEWQKLEVDERQQLTPPLEDVPDDLGKAVDQLLELGLLAPGGKDRFIVHRWTADSLGGLDAAEVHTGHKRAARYWRWRVRVRPQDRMDNVQQHLEARWHHREAGETVEAVEVTETVASQLDTWGAYRWEAHLCREVLEWLPERSFKAAAFLHQLGNIAYRQGAYDEALGWYRKSLEIVEELGDRSGMANSYHQLGMVAQGRGSYDEALSWYRKSLEIEEGLGNRSGLANSYHQLGIVSQLRGSYDDALSWYRKSLEIKEKLGDRLGLAYSYGQMGNVALDRGSYDEASSWYRKSLEIFEELGDRGGVARSYHQLGVVSQRRGLYDEALGWYRKSLEIVEELGDRGGVARSYHQLGIVSQLRGSYDDALSWYRKSLEIMEELGDRSGLARSYHQLGMVSQFRGLYDEALSWYRKSLEIFEELGDRGGVARSYHQLGVVSQRRGLYDEALGWYRKSLEIKKELGDRSGMASAYQQLGRVAVETGKPEEGVPLHLRALSIFIQLKSHKVVLPLRMLTCEEDVLGKERFQEILEENLDNEDRNNIFSLMELCRQLQEEAEAEAGGLEGSA